MVRIRVKGKPYTNKTGEFRRIYIDKNKKEYIKVKGRRKLI